MRIAILILLLLSFDVSAKGKKTKINIHTFGADDETSLILNTETNQYQDSSYINSSLAVSTDNGWDISVSSQNIPIYGDSQSYQMDTYFNVSKDIKLTKQFDISFGAQNGYQLYNTKQIGKLHQFHYSDLTFKLNNYVKFRGGSFYVNKELSTKTNYFGGIAGITISYNDFEITADYFGGHSNVSGATIEVGYYANESIQPYVGIGIPETNSGNEFYGEIGINISTGSLR